MRYPNRRLAELELPLASAGDHAKPIQDLIAEVEIVHLDLAIHIPTAFGGRLVRFSGPGRALGMFPQLHVHRQVFNRG